MLIALILESSEGILVWRIGTFGVINELLEDKTLKFSMLAGHGPVWERMENGVKKGVKIELINYWEEKAIMKGRTIEEFARYTNFLLD